MKVLWLCNMMLPAAARQMGLEESHKEGWVSGMAGALLAHRKENGISLSVAFPLPANLLPKGQDIYGGTAAMEVGHGEEAPFSFYAFSEDVGHPEQYDKNLEPMLKKIVSMVEPDIVHCFGTEYPHTLAMCRIFPRKERLLVGLQGLCALCAEAYYADLPVHVTKTVTLRDWLKRDSLEQQREKFFLRGRMEEEAIGIAGNVTGRTRWDREHAQAMHPEVRYYEMNETLRPEFYGPVWTQDRCEPHSIFLSQGDYPLKGLHYMLCALPSIVKKYPDAKVYVAGNSLVAYGTLKEKLKISAYGRYLRELLRAGELEGRVAFLGKLDAQRMRDRYLASSLFVCCSSLENSPNSLGEGMLLGMPCVSADVGGISSIFTGDEDGILYRGFSKEADDSGESGEEKGALAAISGRLAEAVLRMWADPVKQKEYCANARRHALQTHDRERNYRRLTEIYGKIL